MPSRATAPFEKAVFTEGRKADYTARWTLLLGVMVLLAAVYWVARDVVYHRLLRGYAQRAFNDLASAAIDRIGSVSMDRQGDLTLHDAEAYTLRDGARRLFFRARELRLTLDGIPLRDEGLHVMRVDLHRPEIFVRREGNRQWNLEWALSRAPRGPDPVAPAPPRPIPYAGPDESFPRNGVHIHDGIIHLTIASPSGKEVTWTLRGVRAALHKIDGVLTVHPFTAEFYGGVLKGDAELPRTSPLTIRQLKVDIRDADVARMAEGFPALKHPVSGKFNAVLALAVDRQRTNQRPIIAGHCEISEGNLWEFPAFAGILNLLTLTPVSERRIDSAILEFTVEEDRIRVDKMHFLGYPISLFGDGSCGLTGDWIDITFVPRLGKGDWRSILSVIGAPVDLLIRIFGGALTPVVLSGSFEAPRFVVGSEAEVRPAVKELIKEKSPR